MVGARSRIVAFSVSGGGEVKSHDISSFGLLGVVLGRVVFRGSFRGSSSSSVCR